MGLRRVAGSGGVLHPSVLFVAWLEDVGREWREEWSHRDDHPFSRFSTFLGERFLTDFDLREAERRIRLPIRRFEEDGA